MIGSGRGSGAALRMVATGNVTSPRLGWSRSTGTVRTPHSTRGSTGATPSHEPGSNFGVYFRAWGVVATRVAEAGTVAKAPVESASVAAVMTANAVDVTLTRARLAKGRVDIACNLLVRSPDVGRRSDQMSVAPSETGDGSSVVLLTSQVCGTHRRSPMVEARGRGGRCHHSGAEDGTLA